MLLPLSAKGIKVLTPKYLNDVKKTLQPIIQPEQQNLLS